MTSLPSVAAMVPPPPMSTPSSAPLHAADDAADDRADGRAGADLRDFTLDAFALERLRDGAAHRIVAAANRDLIERDRQAALAVGPARLVDRADDAAHDRAGRESARGSPRTDPRPSSPENDPRPARCRSSARAPDARRPAARSECCGRPGDRLWADGRAAGLSRGGGAGAGGRFRTQARILTTARRRTSPDSPAALRPGRACGGPGSGPAGRCNQSC